MCLRAVLLAARKLVVDFEVRMSIGVSSLCLRPKESLNKC